MNEQIRAKYKSFSGRQFVIVYCSEFLEYNLICMTLLVLHESRCCSYDSSYQQSRTS